MTAVVTDTASADWVVCDGCRRITYQRRYARALDVCAGCGRHGRLTAPRRLEQLLDAGSETPLDPPVVAEDPLGFTDRVPYPERLREARARTGLDEAVRCVRGTIEGQPLVVAAMDFRFLGGSLGCGVGERICRAAEAAGRDRVPLLLVTASGGARMQEGALALMQMAATSASLAALGEAGMLTVTLITDPTYGGVAASFATLTDVILAEPGARIGFAGPRVIEQTIRRRLPDGFQTAEFLLRPRPDRRGGAARGPARHAGPTAPAHRTAGTARHRQHPARPSPRRAATARCCASRTGSRYASPGSRYATPGR